MNTGDPSLSDEFSPIAEDINHPDHPSYTSTTMESLSSSTAFNPNIQSSSNTQNTTESSDSDSDASIEILEVPKKPVPVIFISDSEDENSQLNLVKSFSRNPVDEKQKTTISVKQRLEEHKDKIFPVKIEKSENNHNQSNRHDLTCTICLGNFDDRAFLDSCFHSFCYLCILQWSNVVHTCPLCKSSFKSIIHDIKPDLQYKQHFMEKAKSSTDQQSSWSLNSEVDYGRRFHYRTTSIPGNRRVGDFESQRRYDAWRQRRRLSLSWGNQRSRWSHSAATHDRRRMIYHHGMIVKEVKHHGRPRYRDISLEFLRSNPAMVHRFVPWILRDLNVLLANNAEHVSFVLHLILSLLTRISMESQEFHDQLQPFLSNNTTQFIRELVTFASSPYDMRGYDDKVVYDMPPVAISTGLLGAFANPEPVLQERSISFEDRLMDEAFTASRLEESPPLAPGWDSSSDESCIVNVDRNSDDSDLEITRVVHTQSRSSCRLKLKRIYKHKKSKKESSNSTSERFSPNQPSDRTLQRAETTVTSHGQHPLDSNLDNKSTLKKDPSVRLPSDCSSFSEIVSPSFPPVRSSESFSFPVQKSSPSRSATQNSNSSRHKVKKSKKSLNRERSRSFSPIQSRSSSTYSSKKNQDYPDHEMSSDNARRRKTSSSSERSHVSSSRHKSNKRKHSNRERSRSPASANFSTRKGGSSATHKSKNREHHCNRDRPRSASSSQKSMERQDSLRREPSISSASRKSYNSQDASYRERSRTSSSTHKSKKKKDSYRERSGSSSGSHKSKDKKHSNSERSSSSSSTQRPEKTTDSSNREQLNFSSSSSTSKEKKYSSHLKKPKLVRERSRSPSLSRKSTKSTRESKIRQQSYSPERLMSPSSTLKSLNSPDTGSREDEYASLHRSAGVSSNKAYRNSADSYNESLESKSFGNESKSGSNSDNLYSGTLKSVIVRNTDARDICPTEKKLKHKKRRKHKKRHRGEEESVHSRIPNFDDAAECNRGDNCNNQQKLTNEPQKHADTLTEADRSVNLSDRSAISHVKSKIPDLGEGERTLVSKMDCVDTNDSKNRNQTSHKPFVSCGRQNLQRETAADNSKADFGFSSRAEGCPITANEDVLESQITQFNPIQKSIDNEPPIPDLLKDVKSIDDASISVRKDVLEIGISPIRTVTETNFETSSDTMKFHLDRFVGESGNVKNVTFPISEASGVSKLQTSDDESLKIPTDESKIKDILDDNSLQTSTTVDASRNHLCDKAQVCSGIIEDKSNCSQRLKDEERIIEIDIPSNNSTQTSETLEMNSNLNSNMAISEREDTSQIHDIEIVPKKRKIKIISKSKS